MSKMKSKFRPKIKKSPAPQIWCVGVYEHEAGWGQRMEERLEFPSEEAALKYVQESNAKFRKQGDSDCFALAHPPYKKRDD